MRILLMVVLPLGAGMVIGAFLCLVAIYRGLCGVIARHLF